MFGKSPEKFGKFGNRVRKQGLQNVRKFQKFRKFQKLFYSENYKKMTLNSNFGNREKLVSTQKPTRKCN